MVVPRYRDDGGAYDLCLFCQQCGWAVPRDSITKSWKTCRNRKRTPEGQWIKDEHDNFVLCEGLLVVRKNYYTQLSDEEKRYGARQY